MTDASANYILCPYCESIVAEDTVFCGVCTRDTTRDAKIEMSLQEYLNDPRKACPKCQGLMMKLALICPHCLDARPGL